LTSLPNIWHSSWVKWNKAWICNQQWQNSWPMVQLPQFFYPLTWCVVLLCVMCKHMIPCNITLTHSTIWWAQNSNHPFLLQLPLWKSLTCKSWMLMHWKIGFSQMHKKCIGICQKDTNNTTQCFPFSYIEKTIFSMFWIEPKKNLENF
jgi:hypothetical protein